MRRADHSSRGVELTGGRYVVLINSPHSCADCLEIWEPQFSAFVLPLIILPRDSARFSSITDCSRWSRGIVVSYSKYLPYTQLQVLCGYRKLIFLFRTVLRSTHVAMDLVTRVAFLQSEALPFPKLCVFWLGFQTHTLLILWLNPLNAEINPIRHLLALVGARHIVHVSRLRVKSHPPFASIGRSSPYCPR